VFLHPVYTLSGALWRVGIPVAAAYLIWKPVAILVLFAGAAAWSSRLFADSPWARVAALALSLFMFSPLGALRAWSVPGFSGLPAQVVQPAWEMFPAGTLWGSPASAIAIGLVPGVLLTLERALNGRPAGARWHPLLAPTAGALLVSWLHPWEGFTLLLMLAALAVWDRLRRWRVFAPPALALLAPLAYYALLPRYDADWRIAANTALVPRPGVGAMMAALAPLVLVAFAGIRSPGQDTIERALLLWVPASLATFLLIGAFPVHALGGVSFPLAVLLVRAGRRLRLPALANVIVIAVVTLPGVAFGARVFARAAQSGGQGYYLTSSETRALTWLSDGAPAGGVLAPTAFATEIPAQTGRAVWVGHESWSRDWPQRAAMADALFRGDLSRAEARAVALGSGARLLVEPCGDRARLGQVLRGILAGVHRFGCVTVYVLAPAVREAQSS
jgi:hypothetical protein